MGKKVTPETALKKAVKEYAAYVGIRLWSIMQGLGSSPGIADFLGIYKGKPVAVECKAGRGKLTPDQQIFKKEWEAHGGIFIECRRLEDIAAALGIPTLFG